MAQLSARGARFIGHFEGWRNKPYNDPTNNATIGFGHLLHLGPVTAHDNAQWGTITMQRGVQLLQHDAALAVTALGHYIHRPLEQCQVDALVSFAFNCGGGALAGSVGRAVNANQDPTAALCQWDHSGHVVLQGLLDRRKREAHLFMTGDYGDGKPPSKNGGPPQAKPKPLTQVPTPVPDWAWLWVEWKLGRAKFKGRAGDPALRHLTSAPVTVPPWAWKFLKRFE
jgi:GH24 family phage-related lysozyme (muramidase)